jgi:hypothetical protein
MSREIMQQALSAFEAIMFEKDAESCQIIAKNARYALRQELAKPDNQEPFRPDWVNYRQGLVDGAAQPEQEPVEHAVIAGVLFDFMGWLTSRQERIVLSSCDDASPAVKVIEEFAKMRGLSLDDAKVKDWQDMIAPPRKEWVGLTDGEIEEAWGNTPMMLNARSDTTRKFFACAIEALLKEKNNAV